MLAPTMVERLPSVLAQVAQCCSSDVAIAVFDSALHCKLVGADQLRLALSKLPRALRELELATDPLSESGLESLCRRVISRSVGSSLVRSQVAIAGVGRVDFVVGDRLIVEVDGREWHEGDDPFLADRSRLIGAAARGYATLRPTAHHIMLEPQWLAMTLKRMVSRREHLWSAVHRGDPVCDGYRQAAGR